MVEKRSIVSTVCIYILLLALAFITLLPLFWMISASLKSSPDVFTVPIQWIPQNPRWSNYALIWERIPLTIFTFNSAKLTVLITIIQVLTSSFAAYGFAKCDFKGRNVLFMAYVATIAIPWQAYMLPQYIEMQKLGLVDTHTGYVLMQSFVAFGVFLIRQFYMSIPNELLEAGRIDGLTEYGNFFRIVLPLSRPAVSTLVIFSFVTVWNDFMGPNLYFLSTAKKTIQLGIRMFIGQYSTDYALIMAACTLALIPVVAIFLCFQRFFIQGVATSGLKG